MTDYPELREVPLTDKPMFQGVLIDVSHMQVRLPNGETALREVVHHKGAAAVVPVDGEGCVYLVRQHRGVEALVGQLRRVEDDYRSFSRELTLEEWKKQPLRSTVLDNLARLTSALQ